MNHRHPCHTVSRGTVPSKRVVMRVYFFYVFCGKHLCCIFVLRVYSFCVYVFIGISLCWYAASHFHFHRILIFFGNVLNRIFFNKTNTWNICKEGLVFLQIYFYFSFWLTAFTSHVPPQTSTAPTQSDILISQIAVRFKNCCIANYLLLVATLFVRLLAFIKNNHGKMWFVIPEKSCMLVSCCKVRPPPVFFSQLNMLLNWYPQIPPPDLFSWCANEVFVPQAIALPSPPLCTMAPTRNILNTHWLTSLPKCSYPKGFCVSWYFFEILCFCKPANLPLLIPYCLVFLSDKSSTLNMVGPFFSLVPDLYGTPSCKVIHEVLRSPTDAGFFPQHIAPKSRLNLRIFCENILRNVTKSPNRTTPKEFL